MDRLVDFIETYSPSLTIARFETALASTIHNSLCSILPVSFLSLPCPNITFGDLQVVKSLSEWIFEQQRTFHNSMDQMECGKTAKRASKQETHQASNESNSRPIKQLTKQADIITHPAQTSQVATRGLAGKIQSSVHFLAAAE